VLRQPQAIAQLDRPVNEGPPPDCVAGLYEGTFTGVISAAGYSDIAVYGTVSMTMEQVQIPGEEFRFEIRDGTMSGLAMDSFPFEGTLSGTLNCQTATLENGSIDDAYVDVMGTRYYFTGILAADYVWHEHRFVDGTWSGESVGGTETGQGTWDAAHAP
jgi:hypothetical protein